MGPAATCRPSLGVLRHEPCATQDSPDTELYSQVMGR